MNKITIKLAWTIAFLFIQFYASAQYCTPSFADPSQHYISRVQLGTIDNTSTYISTSNSYSDFTTESTDLIVGNTYTLTIHTERVDSWREAGYGVWIDYNNDGDFTDPNETIWTFSRSANSPQSTTFTVPVSASATSLRMRINMVSWYAPGPCAIDNGNFGETEDYTVNIIHSPNPNAIDDELVVLKNSTASVSNQIDVSVNDNIGTSDGSDGDDYALATSPANGTVTEISDGIFEYIPNSGFLGEDSFTYALCDSNNDCDTALVTVVVNLGHCEPTSSSEGSHYITNFTLNGDTSNINNNSGDDGGYASYLGEGYADLTQENTYTASITTVGDRMGWAIYIDLNQDGDFTDAGERIGDTNGEGTGDLNITIPATAVLGETVLRVGARRYWSSNVPCGNVNNQPEEFEDYKVVITSNVITQDIQLIGNSNFIEDGDTTTSVDNHTYYGIYDINSGALNRFFTIRNDGVTNLTLLAPYVSVTGSTDFTITTLPSSTILAPDESVTFEIAFNPSLIGNIEADVTVYSDDPDENIYTFKVAGEGAQTFPDTDGDGVSDNIDLDDDNDGITDEEETLSCTSYPYASTTDLVFLNETFGAGTNRVMINGNYAGVTTSYCYEDGTGSCTATYNPTSVNDGDYTVHHIVTNDNDIDDGIDTDISNWAEDYWYAGEDHTPGDTYGRMAIFNANEEPGVFYSQFISGAVANVPIQFGFYAINLDRDDIDATELASRLRPEVVITIYDPNGNVIASETSGLIEPTSPAGDWVEVSASFTTTYTQFTVELSNAQLGGLGNDLAIDDVFVKQTLCDLDGDGVADIIDLDNDNDGIPNVVELGLIDDNYDATVFNDATNPWLDVNGNGLHDAYEGLVPRDSDGDGVPDYLDLDSDNDGVFDNVEYNGLGDIDVNGDGVGEGTDYEDNSNKIDNNDVDGDGILSLMDDNDDDSDTVSTTDHGTFSYPDPLDTDGDGIPDYLDIDSNDASNDPSNGSDIDTTVYAHLDADNDGIIDGTIDSDKDGLLDGFDTDNNAYGSPRDLDDSYSLYFDGRNDYVEDGNVLVSGNASLMVWIKTDGKNYTNTNGVIAGQTNFYLVLNHTDNSVTLMLNGSAVITSADLVQDGVWTHITATTHSGETTLYINGKKQEGALSNGGMSADTSNFTIGKRSGIDSNYFKGEIDEVRVFNTALTEEEQQYTIYQELDENFSFNQGKIIPKLISENSIGGNLVKYYKMDGFKDDITDNKVSPAIDEGSGAKLYNIKNIYFQTAPLPYLTTNNGQWTTESTWLYGDVWDIENVADNKDWSIVHIKHNITSNSSHTNLGLLIDEDKRLTINGDNKVENNWYLELNGVLDLSDDSQLVQTSKSDLITSSTGKILRRQEGASNKYWYNYWASPVGVQGATLLTDNNTENNNNDNSTFNVGMLKKPDGNNFEFTNAYHETGKISRYWLYAFQNGVTYYDYESLDENSNIQPGVGYTQKGTGISDSEQQYVFEGKPNNGTIIVPVTDTGGDGSVPAESKTDYMLGNPYPSAIDLHKFIDDNEDVIEGSIQLWQQWSGNSHVLNDYNGGYAVVTKTGGIRAYQFVGIEGDTNGNQDGTKIPTRYLPVGQGFMVEIVADGNVEFNNSQRLFIKESDADGSYENGSVFFRTASSSQSSTADNQDGFEESLMQRIRIELNSVDGPETKRELLLGFSEVTTDAYDYGYEARNTADNSDDLSLLVANEKYLIHAYAEITEDKVVPLTLKASGNYNYSIKLTELENIPEDQNIYLKDNLTEVYYDLRSQDSYEFLSEAGEFNDRFEIVFQTEENALSIIDNQVENLKMYYASGRNKIVILNPKIEKIEGIRIVNMLGQEVVSINSAYQEAYAEYQLSEIATGTYIIVLTTKSRGTITKKIVVN